VIFFDLDGTLLDYDAAHAAGLAALYRACRSRLGLDEASFYRAWFGLGGRHLKRYLPGRGGFTRQQVARTQQLFGLAGRPIPLSDAREVYASYLAAFEARWEAFDDVGACLDSLTDRRLGVLTNGDPDQQTRKLAVMGLEQRFELLVTPLDAGAGKPDPRIFRHACRCAGETPGACAYVGDDLELDIVPAAELGMQAIWLNRRKSPQEVPRGVAQIAGLADLRRLLSGRPATAGPRPRWHRQ